MEVTIHNQTKSGEIGEHKFLLNKNDKIKEFISDIKEKLKIKISTNNIGIFFIDKNNKKIYFTNREKTLGNYGVDDFAEIILKDFGTQIDWRLVYIVEYLGPLFIFPSFYFFNLSKSNLSQKMGLLMGVFHFGKRVLESLFVHKFSRDTMPIKNLFVNVIYYWLLFGISCGYSLFNNHYSNSLSNMSCLYFGLFFVFEYMNFKCHMLQKIAKEESQGEYKILPGKYGFQYVSCANYFWEFLSWLSFSLFTGTINFYVFTFCGLFVMTKWAMEKHSNFKRLFGDNYPRERKAILPFVI
jgi:very-long-chain enoyl-CoA reductase